MRLPDTVYLWLLWCVVFGQVKNIVAGAHRTSLLEKRVGDATQLIECLTFNHVFDNKVARLFVVRNLVLL